MNMNLKDAKILIVDDQPANIEVLEDLLMMQSYVNIRSTTDPRKVLDMVKESKPDLLLLDLMMPHMSGFEVMEQLKANGYTDGTMPILVLTADATKETKQKSLSGGASDFLTKPFDLIEVDLRIKNLLYTVYLLTQLKNHNQLLEEKVKERTAELRLANVELTLAKNKAEEVNKLKSFFLSNISHELRTPLISILGFSELLAMELTEPSQVESINYINESGQRLQRALNDILALTDLEKKKLDTNFHKTDLTEFIKSLSGDYRHRIEGHHLSFDEIYPSDEILLYTDQNLLKHILDSVIDNSIKFTKRGGITLVVNQQRKNDISYATINITDTGIGISPELIKNIYTPFWQASEGLSRSHEGLGLGLSVVKQLVEILQGEVVIHSELNSGTSLILHLPIYQSEAEVSNKINQIKKSINEFETNSAFSTKESASTKPRLLMVEDNPGNRTLFRRILTSEFLVEEAGTGESAVAMSEINKYDIILMDINLGPGIDGIETFRRIRKINGFEDTPIIAVTAFAMKEDRQKFLEIGFNDYIQKPILKDEFIAMIIAHCKK